MPVATDGDDERPEIDVSHARGVIVGEHNVIHNFFYPLQQAISQLPDHPDVTPLKAELERGLERVESRLAQLDEALAQRDKRSSRSGNRLFVLGLVLGLPLGVAGSYVAYLLGIN